MKLIKKFNYRKIVSLIWQQQGDPFFNAKGLGIGVFSGCFPFFGFQTFLGILLAKLFRGNIVLAAIGTWISNPFTYIPLYLLNYKVGSIFIISKINIDINTFSNNENIFQKGFDVVLRLIIGSCIVGIIFGILSGFLSYLFYKKIFNRKILK